ncbi:MAG: hypothetical protein KCHDKBKB_01564 [Elusimicrobia bacterium]|nr:hypothetical protein [Elusimicrobiota bacterium]
MRNIRRIVGLVSAIVFSESVVFGLGSGGIANEVTSAEHLSQLLAITGSKNDPTTVYNNPASIGDLGKYSGTLGMMFYRFSAERTGSNGTSDKMKTGYPIVPNMAATYGWGDGKYGFGIAVLSPFGLETEWSDTSNVRYVATKSTLKMVDITPAFSYRPSEKMALGLGVDYFWTMDADLQKKANVDVINTAVGFPTAGSSDANSRLSGDGSQWGYHAGMLFNPSPSHTIGLAYHSEVKTKIEGDLEITGLSGASASAGVFGGTDYKTPVRTDLFYPQHVQFGYKYSRENKWEAGFNLAWYDWSSNKELAINLPNATATQRALAGAPVPLDWRDVWSASIGGNYRFTETWKLNAGAYYIPAVYPESTFSPAVPDMNKIGLSIGPSYSKNSWSIDTVYNPIFYKTTTINNNLGQSQNGGLAAADISGEYKAMIHILGVNVRYNFR